MAEKDPEFRHSIAMLHKNIIGSVAERRASEVQNYLRQYDASVEFIRRALAQRLFKLKVSDVLSIHRHGYAGLSQYAGVFRPVEVSIEGSDLKPPSPKLLPELVEEMCDYINENWKSATPIHLAAYSMWRLNWIHPFVEGNGTTARTLSYIILCTRLGLILPGTPTIPDYIVDNRKPYFDALDVADTAFRNGKIDVSMMEGLLSTLLAKQLTSFYESAGGKLPD